MKTARNDFNFSVFEMPLNNAEKCKNYRNRKKNATLKIKKTSLTSAERSRMYRLRKKQLTQGINSCVNEVLYTPSTSNSRMTFEASPQHVTTVFKMVKTNAEICRDYYYRKKAAKEAEKIRQGLSVQKPKKKTDVERSRAYRLRKKILSLNESSVTEIISIPSTSSSRIKTSERSFQLATSFSKNQPDLSTVPSTGFADIDDSAVDRNVIQENDDNMVLGGSGGIHLLQEDIKKENITQEDEDEHEDLHSMDPLVDSSYLPLKSGSIHQPQLSQNEDSVENELLTEIKIEYPDEVYDNDLQVRSENERIPNGITEPDVNTQEVTRKRKYEMTADNTLGDSKDQNEEKDHEFDLFCRSLAIQLKKMPLERALICQERLQSVMVQERLSQMSSPQTNPSNTIIQPVCSPAVAHLGKFGPYIIPIIQRKPS